MIEVKKLGILLEKTTDGFEIDGVLNPAVIQEKQIIHVFYRAVAKNNYSSIGCCKLNAAHEVIERSDMPLLFPQFDYESHGVEDPRIVQIQGTYYLTYTAYDGVNALGALATSSDLSHWEKQGIITPQIVYSDFLRLAETKHPLNEKYARYNSTHNILEKNGKKMLLWDKNIVFFPRKINNKFYLLHRIKPDIQIVGFTDLLELTPEFWQNYFMNIKDCIALSPKLDHEISYIGCGAPPIETEKGWLLIYHGVHDTVEGFVYSACAALLDLEHPEKEISRLSYPLFYPEQTWEMKGEVNNVCFPTGTTISGDTLYIYYGAADERIAYASVSLSALLTELTLNTQ